MAVRKLLIEKPFTIREHSQMINAFIISKKSPSVSTVTGKVRITSTGFTIKFNNAKTTATMIEVVKSGTATPGKKCAITRTSIAVNKIRIKRFISCFFVY